MKASIIIFLATILALSAISLAQTSPEETCIRRNLGRFLAPSPAGELRRFKYEFPVDAFCRDMGREVWFYVRLNGKFPSYYVKALCNVFGGDDQKVKAYVDKRWLGNLKLMDGLSCASL